MATCWSVTGLLLVALAMIATIISFAAPFWYKVSFPQKHVGLWGECDEVGGSCNWFYENDYRWENQQTKWWKACQGLMAFGTVTIIISFFLVSFNMCCRCCDQYCINRTLCSLLFIAFLEIAVALGVFGGYANKELGASINGRTEFDWGFWIGICGAGLDLLACIIFFMNTCCRSD